MTWSIIVGFFIGCLRIKLVESDFTACLKNTALLVGDRLSLSCSSKDGRITWYRNNGSSCSMSKISPGNGKLLLGVMYGDNRISKLVTPFVTMEAAGVYSCGTEIRGVRSQVIVLEAHPHCWIRQLRVFESDFTTAACSVIYNGRWGPVMKWFNTHGENIVGNFSSVITDKGTITTSSISVKVTREMNGVQFRCKTYFDQPVFDADFSQHSGCNSDHDKLFTWATNVPLYTYVWTSPMRSVTEHNPAGKKESANLRPKRAASNETHCSQTVAVGNQIALGQSGLQCMWYVSTSSLSEHYVSAQPILLIDQARLGDSGLYKCYVNGAVMLSCQVNVIYNWELETCNFCTANAGENISCPANPPSSLSIRSHQTIYGTCQVSGTPHPFIRWMFCPDVCDVTPTNVTSLNTCLVVNNGSFGSSYFQQLDVTTNQNGLYVCVVKMQDVVETFYNVCIAVDQECAGERLWWNWNQAAVSIITVDVIAAICFLLMMNVILLDKESTITFCSRVLLVVLNHSVLLILAVMVIIGCAFRLSKDSDSVAEKWETGIIVMFALLLFFCLFSAIVTGCCRCRGREHLIVTIVWNVLTILVTLAALIWTLLNMSRCRNVPQAVDSREWSWEIFLVALACAILVFGLLSLLWYMRRTKHCRCCGGNTRQVCHFSCGKHKHELIRVGSASSAHTGNPSNNGNESDQSRRHTVKKTGFENCRQRYTWAPCICICCHWRKTDDNAHISGSRNEDEMKKEEPQNNSKNTVHYTWKPSVCCGYNHAISDVTENKTGSPVRCGKHCCFKCHCFSTKKNKSQRNIDHAKEIKNDSQSSGKDKIGKKSKENDEISDCYQLSDNGRQEKSNETEIAQTARKNVNDNDKNEERQKQTKYRKPNSSISDSFAELNQVPTTLKPSYKSGTNSEMTGSKKGGRLRSKINEQNTENDRDDNKEAQNIENGQTTQRTRNFSGGDEITYFRMKSNEDYMFPPIFDKIELQSNSAHDRPAYFAPPRRVTAASVLDVNDRSTPLTPGRDHVLETRLNEIDKKAKKKE